MKVFLAVIVIVIVVAVFFIFKPSPSNNKEPTNKSMSQLILKSSVFQEGGFIPKKYTCAGENINPSLEIENVPASAKSLVLIMDDPDARLPAPERSDGRRASAGITWDHWLLWNIPLETQTINEDDAPLNAVYGTTSFGELKYGGPCPPPGKIHHYRFKLYALDIKLNLSVGAKKSEIEKAMEGNILAQTTLIGLYERK